MAYCDYLHCDVCDTKCLYDADVDYRNGNARAIGVLCEDCAEKHEIVVRRKDTGDILPRPDHWGDWLAQFSREPTSDDADSKPERGDDDT